jgi:hypothetical protein
MFIVGGSIMTLTPTRGEHFNSLPDQIYHGTLLVLIRLISLIAFLVAKERVHKIPRTNTNKKPPKLNRTTLLALTISVPRRSAVFDLKAPDDADLGLEFDANYHFNKILPATGEYFLTVVRPTSSPGK